MSLSVGVHWLLAVGAFILIRVIHAPPLSVWIFFICFVFLLGLTIFARFRSGKWMNIKVIEEEELITEAHQPIVKAISEWM